MAAGERRRNLPETLPDRLQLPTGFARPKVALPGILVVSGPSCGRGRGATDPEIETFCAAFADDAPINAFPLIVIVDDSEFVAARLENFLWVTFTRSDPATDLYGIGAETMAKHWGCRGALVIDARTKPHHAPPLETDPVVERRVDELGAPGGPLHGLV